MVSDNGGQSIGERPEKEPEAPGIGHEITSRNNPKGNVDTKRFMRTFNEEIVCPHAFTSLDGATKAGNAFLIFWNTENLRSTLEGTQSCGIHTISGLVTRNSPQKHASNRRKKKCLDFEGALRYDKLFLFGDIFSPQISNTTEASGR